MTDWACRFTQSAWSVDGSSGPRRWMVPSPSLRPNSAICWRELTGVIRNEHGVRSRRVKSHVSNDVNRILRYQSPPNSDSIIGVTQAANIPPDDLDALRTALAAEQLARREAEARPTGAEAMVAHLK